ncbi:MAG: 50S ribosomal protein L17 [Candidatus Woykebacteria bacterium RBG_16_44_10]|uniref:Large ribosomal subunit protein bL17 n=1 Tax=Candidatus Woykebacteria bacterium RBG_16_44_10 TaxID=1802597 RepID=A0A1G1WFG4_9BACT|nr:MAG: 50S ribosomal protein L17 [Candidatus Woykebacteria bacterium RBG_16_44_10]
MVHRVAARKLSRDSSHRAAILKNLASAAILHEKIVTTLPRAKAVRPFLEKLITKTKENNLENRRYLLARLGAPRPVQKLLDVIGPAFKERPGGYTRITKLPPRVGDSAPMASLEFVENVSELAAKRKIEEKPSKEAKAKKKIDKKSPIVKAKGEIKESEVDSKNEEKAKPTPKKP